MMPQNVKKLRNKKESPLTKVEQDDNVTIYENNKSVAEIRSAVGVPLQEHVSSHIIRRKKRHHC